MKEHHKSNLTIPQKIWREIKRPFRRCLKDKKHSHKGEFRDAPQNGLPRAMLMEDGRVKIPQVETFLSNACNLKCDQCLHMSPMRKGVVPAQDIVNWFRAWKHKIFPQKIYLLGGEPLLNKDLAFIVQEIKDHYPHSKIIIISNGVLVASLKDEVFQVIKETGTSFSISEYILNEAMYKKRLEGIEILRQKNIDYECHPVSKWWMLAYKTECNGRILPLRSDPRKAFVRCPKVCVALWDNLLFKCSILANRIEAYREGILDDAWNSVLTYKPLCTGSSAEDICAHLNESEIPQCCTCPE